MSNCRLIPKETVCAQGVSCIEATGEPRRRRFLASILRDRQVRKTLTVNGNVVLCTLLAQQSYILKRAEYDADLTGACRWYWRPVVQKEARLGDCIEGRAANLISGRMTGIAEGMN